MSFLFHPNPLRKLHRDQWEDTNTHSIIVKAVSVKASINPERWAVYHQTKEGKLTLISQHITEEAAVVIGQREANRRWLKAQGRARRSPTPTVTRAPKNGIKSSDRKKMENLLRYAITGYNLGRHDDARKDAQDLVDLLTHHFGLGDASCKDNVLQFRSAAG